MMDNNLIATLVVAVFFGVASATLISLCEKIADYRTMRRCKRALNAPWHPSWKDYEHDH